MGRKYLKPFLAVGFMLATVIFFDSSSIPAYALSVFLFTLFVGSLGWMVDKAILNQYSRLKTLAAIYVLIGVVYAVLTIFTARCLGSTTLVYENAFTGECRDFAVGCGRFAPWYWRETQNETCIETAFRNKCESIPPEELERVYGGSCDRYVQLTMQSYK